MRARRALLFGTAGLAFGWMAAVLFSSPFVGLTPFRHPWLAALGGALGCALLGSVRTTQRHHLVLGLVGVGAAVGLVVGGRVAVSTPHYAASAGPGGMLLGALAGMVTAPAFLWLEKARSAPLRAREGSLLAQNEQRRAWYVLVLLACMASLASLPDWFAHGTGLIAPPWEGDVVAGALAVGLSLLAILESLDAIRLRRAVSFRQRLTAYGDDPERALARSDTIVDLGLGDELRTRPVASAAYRGPERHDVAVRGDPTLARRALAAAMPRFAMCLVAIGICGALARLVAMPAVAFALHRQRCAFGDLRSCIYGLGMIDQGLVDPYSTAQIAGPMLAQACASGLRHAKCEGR